ncbi:MAG: LON peptidase substrate-binding domain-containing protein [Acidimicrobiia bacterium]
MSVRLPMFPLGTVLFPHASLPLHVFEPRYRALVADCLAGRNPFGVVLIERGSEVGGGDQRFGVGTRARIIEAVELPDGRWLIHAVGTERIRIDRWLEDDPYPCAEVTDLSDGPAGPRAADARVEVERLLRQVLALRSELGESVPDAAVTLDGDPALAAYQATVLASPGPLDAQRILEADGAEERLARIAVVLADDLDTLTRRLTAN